MGAGFLKTANFDFLSAHDARLMKLGGLAERYFRDDPSTSLFKLRQFSELLAKLIAAHHALYDDDRQSFEETLRRLSFDPQKRWLKRIGEQVEKEIVVDREAIDKEPFVADGGFARLNKVFGGELETVLAGINEEMWKKTA